MNIEWLRGEGVNSASNALVLSKTLQTAFNGLELTLLESVSPL